MFNGRLASPFHLAGLAIPAAILVLGASLPASANRSSADASTARTAGRSSIVIVTAGRPSEYQFQVSPKTVKRGSVIFKITNLGKKPHSFGINGHVSKVLPSHASTTLTVAFKKGAQYYYTDTCVVDPNVEDANGTPCAGGLLKVI